MTKRELEAEVGRLRNEVAFLRSQQVAHVCPQWPVNLTWPYPPPAQPQCTCGTSVRCMRHFPSDWGHNIWVNAGCAAGVQQTYVVEPSGLPLTFWSDTAGWAGGIAQTFTVNVPA